MAKLSNDIRGVLRTFAFWLANGTVGHPLLDGVDYTCIFNEPSELEQTMAIFANVIEFDEQGRVLNAKHAEQRAAQFIRSYVDVRYKVQPAFEGWVVELH